MQNPFDQQRPIPGIRNIICVSSGKGGVGKSTVSTNLAMAMSKLGAKVGLLDADIYGPSIPRMFGVINQKPNITTDRLIEPIKRYGLSLMSMGFLMDEKSAVIWRGPLLFKAMEQLFREVAWGELDYLFIDLPPGTGDVQLSVVQKVPVTAAVTVTTPQNIALIDVKKAIDMFQRVNVPIAGVIENMSDLFPKGELHQYLDKERLEKLGDVPFVKDLAMACEVGIPLAENHADGQVPVIFEKIAQRLKEKYP